MDYLIDLCEEDARSKRHKNIHDGEVYDVRDSSQQRVSADAMKSHESQE